jgi:putative glutathione S-transferase
MLPAKRSRSNGADIKEHYYYSHPQNNPKRIVPLGPKLNIEPLEKK